MSQLGAGADAAVDIPHSPFPCPHDVPTVSPCPSSVAAERARRGTFPMSPGDPTVSPMPQLVAGAAPLAVDIPHSPCPHGVPTVSPCPSFRAGSRRAPPWTFPIPHSPCPHGVPNGVPMSQLGAGSGRGAHAPPRGHSPFPMSPRCPHGVPMSQLSAGADAHRRGHSPFPIPMSPRCPHGVPMSQLGAGADAHRRGHSPFPCPHGVPTVSPCPSSVRERTRTAVDMRVGVHSGAVLGGVLGQKRWQYDVWSTDVTVANKMEAGGIPGRVHVSQSTVDCLKGEFEVEPGEGGSRCDYLRDKGIVTYLVVVPKQGLRHGVNGGVPGQCPQALLAVSPGYPGNVPSLSPHCAQVPNPSFPNPRRRLRLRDLAERVAGAAQNEQELNRLLNEALLERESIQALKGRSTFRLSLRFTDPAMETRYSVEKEKQSGAAFGCSCVVLAFSALMEALADPWLVANYVTFVVGEVLLVGLTLCSLAAVFPRAFPKRLVAFSTWIDRTRWARNSWAMAAIAIVTAADVVDMLACHRHRWLVTNGTSGPPRGGGCADHPKSFSYIALLALVATVMLVQVSHMVKLTLMVLITAATGAVNFSAWGPIFDHYDRRRGQPSSSVLVPSKYSMTAMIFVVMLSFYYFSRHVEKLARTLFLWKIDVHDQKERVSEMRRWNEALVANMLPEHVARHFLGSKKRDEELYSQSYEEIGVMFASLPNFADFYTEESINNGGIECLRFLNEIISDFDALLDEPQFRCITKIKTIGSTYMAPHVEHGVKEPGSEKERWQHLADLADFALAMKVTLMNINYQSFNNFMLRIGMNKGAVLAGVIGARKPHYDIWGNTVNVASRMESTGVMGNIQVVEETQQILKEYGFRFGAPRRGAVYVKGKGELLTFFLKGREKPGSLLGSAAVPLPHQVLENS
uniref:adenylate cyclase n=1 Tax=Geospiza parvula TaxID=87175 RepID=A0A8U8AYL9_GEOPR